MPYCEHLEITEAIIMQDQNDDLMSKYPKLMPYLIDTYVNYVLDIGDIPNIVIRVHENSHEKLKELADGYSLFSFPIDGFFDTYTYFTDDHGFCYSRFESDIDEDPTWVIEAPLEDIECVMSQKYNLNFKLDINYEPCNLSPKLKEEIDKEDMVKTKEEEVLLRRAQFRIVK